MQSIQHLGLQHQRADLRQPITSINDEELLEEAEKTNFKLLPVVFLEIPPVFLLLLLSHFDLVIALANDSGRWGA